MGGGRGGGRNERVKETGVGDGKELSFLYLQCKAGHP